MKRYRVMIEEFNRIDDSVSGGALIDEWFDTEEDAREYYDHIDIAAEYKSDLTRAEKRERYVEKSLACGEWVDDDGEMIFDGITSTQRAPGSISATATATEISTSSRRRTASASFGRSATSTE